MNDCKFGYQIHAQNQCFKFLFSKRIKKISNSFSQLNSSCTHFGHMTEIKFSLNILLGIIGQNNILP